ncbi:MAG: NUDIX domain-containing protein [Myxococcales bacterium]|nr:NUDIX domain-containing protein [Myxococcales bacterium]
MNPPVRDRFCSFCGTAHVEPLKYPRRCVNPACGVTVWANPIPVGVVLLPVHRGDARGLMVLRRGIEPQKGRLALPGGFLEEHESWQAGSARELREELNIVIDPQTLVPQGFSSSAPRPNRVLLFSVAAPVAASALGAFEANHETLERGAVWGPEGLAEAFAFSLHVEAASRWFAAEGLSGPARYEQL